jgi:hypothetical protein
MDLEICLKCEVSLVGVHATYFGFFSEDLIVPELGSGLGSSFHVCQRKQRVYMSLLDRKAIDITRQMVFRYQLYA